MSSGTPVEQVAGYLVAHGYRRMTLPLVISGLTFHVPAALIGVNKSTDLILVADTAFDKSEKILRVVRAVARALDVARSRRPLTTVVVGPPPDATTHEALSSVCRVLAIGRIDGGKAEQVLKNWLAVLTPLNLPDPGNRIADPLAELEAGLIEDVGEELAELVDVAVQGSDAVKRRLNEVLEASMQRALAASGEPPTEQDTTDQSNIERKFQTLGDAEE